MDNRASLSGSLTPKYPKYPTPSLVTNASEGVHGEQAVAFSAVPEARRVFLRAAPGYLRAPHGRAGLRVGAELVRPMGCGARQEAGNSGNNRAGVNQRGRYVAVVVVVQLLVQLAFLS